MIGTGYVGLVTGTCFAETGNDVILRRYRRQKDRDLCGRGEIPIYEPGLTELVLRNARSGRLKFTTDYKEAVPAAQCVFIAVGTPQGDDGSANLTGLWKVVETLAPLLGQVGDRGDQKHRARRDQPGRRRAALSDFAAETSTSPPTPSS